MTRAETPDPMSRRKVRKGPSTAASGREMGKSAGQERLLMQVSANITPYIVTTILVRLVIGGNFSAERFR